MSFDNVSDGTVVLADDHEDTRRVLAELLRGDGWTVLEARDGLELLGLAAAHLPDAVITDLSMPRLGGLEAARVLRRRPGLADRLLVAITAWRLTKLERHEIGLVFDYVLEKPVRTEELRRSLVAVEAG